MVHFKKWTACLICSLLAAATVYGQTPVSFPAISEVSTGDTIYVNINVEDKLPAAPKAWSFEATISFDSSTISFTEKSIWSGTLGEDLAAVAVNVTEAGRMRVAGYGGIIKRGPGVLLYLEAVVESAGTSPLVFEEFLFNEGHPAVTTRNGMLEASY